MIELFMIGALCTVPNSPTLTLGATEAVVTGAPANHFGVVAYSPISVPPTPFGSGQLCVFPFGAAAGRTRAAQADPLGFAVLELPPVGMYSQAIWRQPGGGWVTSNLVTP